MAVKCEDLRLVDKKAATQFPLRPFGSKRNSSIGKRSYKKHRNALDSQPQILVLINSLVS